MTAVLQCLDITESSTQTGIVPAFSRLLPACAKFSGMLHGSADTLATAICGYRRRLGLAKSMVANRNPAPSANV